MKANIGGKQIMKKVFKYIFTLVLCAGLFLGSTSESYCWSGECIKALEAKYGPNWTDYRHTQELKDYVNYNSYRISIGVGGWDNPQDPPAGWQWGDPVDGSGSASTSTPSTPACEHNYEAKITVQPSCIEEGEITYTCSKCKKSHKESLEPIGEHDYTSSISKEATCTEAGETTYTCSMCGDAYTEEIPMIEHEYLDLITKENTCTEDGERTFNCELCGDTYTEVIPAKGHSEGDFEVIVKNGWFTEGEQVQKCVSCGEVLKTEVIPSLYPFWYLYVIIGFVIVLSVITGVIIGKLIKNMRRR